ncbi:glutelin type-A 2-like [Prosopis cineraria]|uniref:glutelin type-A 2-like n=1 Tax=Prosopis cineraria TaxID=364024 RepID=UPI00240EEE00|nr:glutelin type-A 2-like [Prosopis cineraria]XP_054778604.1 glutelin type-A 2-like [Prosopis cineraria]
MEMDLTPKKAEPIFEGDGGSYYLWSSSQVPVLAQNNVGAGRLVLQPQGFALPHYADSAKLGYVIQGTDGVVGMVLPNTDKEVILKLKKGDVIPVPMGAVSWWFNNGESELIIVFLGETSQAHVPGQFTYFLLAGTQGIMGGFSSEVITKAYSLTNKEAKRLTKSQKGVLILKLKKGQPRMPAPQMDKTKEMVYNIDAAEPDHGVKHRGLVTTLTDLDFPFAGEVGLSMIRVKLEPNAIATPLYLRSPSVQVIYVARGSGKIEIVGLNGESVLDSQVEAGQLIVVPKFFVSTQIASEDGMELYSILTTKRPVFEELAGKPSIWEAMSPQVQEVSLNVDPNFVKFFLSNQEHTTNTIPPSN